MSTPFWKGFVIQGREKVINYSHLWKKQNKKTCSKKKMYNHLPIYFKIFSKFQNGQLNQLNLKLSLLFRLWLKLFVSIFVGAKDWHANHNNSVISTYIWSYRWNASIFTLNLFTFSVLDIGWEFFWELSSGNSTKIASTTFKTKESTFLACHNVYWTSSFVTDIQHSEAKEISIVQKT